MTDRKPYRILFTGDVVLSADRAAPEFVKNTIASLEADCVVGNCEIPLTERGTRGAKFVAWRTSPSVAQRTQDLGFDIMTLANNHALDYGREGLEDTLAAFRKAGVQTAGTGDDIDTAFSEATVEFDMQTKVAIIGVACTLPLGFAADVNHPGVAPIHVSTRYEFDPMDIQDEPGCLPTFIHTQADSGDVERLCKRISRLKTEGYLVFVTIHWGNAFQERLAQYQQPLARALQQAGCALIIGHHPHTIQGMEIIERMPVLYSLGNFIMDKTTVEQGECHLPTGMATEWTMSPEALVATIEISNGSVSALEILPVVLDANGFPDRASGAVSEAILRRFKMRSVGRIVWKSEDNTEIIRF